MMEFDASTKVTYSDYTDRILLSRRWGQKNSDTHTKDEDNHVGVCVGEQRSYTGEKPSKGAKNRVPVERNSMDDACRFFYMLSVLGKNITINLWIEKEKKVPWRYMNSDLGFVGVPFNTNSVPLNVPRDFVETIRVYTYG
jgi:hypothetical protein